MRVWTVMLCAAALSASVPLAATTIYPQEIRCPVGGRTFTHQAIGSYTTFGQLPDGQPIGTLQFPVPLPQCPDNGLVVYAEFDAATTRRLAPIVLGAEYQALRRTETPHYLAYWLRTKLGETGKDVAWTLLAATWEAKGAGDPARSRRYAEAFVAGVAALPVDLAALDSIALRARAANALRELGRFDEAEARRAAIVVGEAAGGSDAEAAESRAGWTAYLASLTPVIARRDASRAPIDLLPPREVAFRCIEPERAAADREHADPLTPFEQDFCRRAEIAPTVAELRGALAR